MKICLDRNMCLSSEGGQLGEKNNKKQIYLQNACHFESPNLEMDSPRYLCFS